MRTLLLLGVLFCAHIGLANPATAQEQARAGQCRFAGTWYATGFTTRIDSERRWATWSGNSTEGSPESQGWVLTDGELMTFDNDGYERGYAYVWSFEDDCAVLDLVLVQQRGQPIENGYHIRFNRSR